MRCNEVVFQRYLSVCLFFCSALRLASFPCAKNWEAHKTHAVGDVAQTGVRCLSTMTVSPKRRCRTHPVLPFQPGAYHTPCLCTPPPPSRAVSAQDLPTPIGQHRCLPVPRLRGPPLAGTNARLTGPRTFGSDFDLSRGRGREIRHRHPRSVFLHVGSVWGRWAIVVRKRFRSRRGKAVCFPPPCANYLMMMM